MTEISPYITKFPKPGQYIRICDDTGKECYYLSLNDILYISQENWCGNAEVQICLANGNGGNLGNLSITVTYTTIERARLAAEYLFNCWQNWEIDCLTAGENFIFDAS